MECRSIMSCPPTRMASHYSLYDAVKLMIFQHRTNMLIVNKEEVFLGEITANRLIDLVLPNSLTMDKGLMFTAFMRETREDLVERFCDIANQPVSEFIDTDIPHVWPDSPLIDALQILRKRHTTVPVLERETRKLVGAISFVTLFRTMAEECDKTIGHV